MAKGQNLSRYQQGIVRRHYEHIETTTLQTLSELVSDLFLENSPNKLDQLWKRVEKAMAKSEADKGAVRRTLESRDVESLAKIVNELAAPGAKAVGKR